jgi:hypothetical protein
VRRYYVLARRCVLVLANLSIYPCTRGQRLYRNLDIFSQVSVQRAPLQVLAELEHNDEHSFFKPLRLPRQELAALVTRPTPSTIARVEPIPPSFFTGCRTLLRDSFRTPTNHDRQDEGGRLVSDAFGVLRWLNRYATLWPPAAPSTANLSQDGLQFCVDLSFAGINSQGVLSPSRSNLVFHFFFNLYMSAGDYTFRLAYTLSTAVTAVAPTNVSSPAPASGPFSPAQLSLLINQPALAGSTVGGIPSTSTPDPNIPRRFQVNSVTLTVANPDSGWVSRPLLGLGHSVPLDMSQILVSPRAAHGAGPDQTHTSTATSTMNAVSTAVTTDTTATSASRPPLAVALTPFALASLASSNPVPAQGVVSTAAWAQVLASHAGDAGAHRFSPYEMLGVAKLPSTPRPSPDTPVASSVVPTAPARTSCPWMGLELCVNVRDLESNHTIQLRTPVLVCRAPKHGPAAVSSPAPPSPSTCAPSHNGDPMFWHRKWEAETEARDTREQAKATTMAQAQTSVSSSTPLPPPPQTSLSWRETKPPAPQ